MAPTGSSTPAFSKKKTLCTTTTPATAPMTTAAHGSTKAQDAVIATNTTISRDGVEGLANSEQAGGLSGAPLKDRATAKGLFFVSVFDSCNSATATRDGATGQSRSAPALIGAAPPAPATASTSTSAGGDGYWVHLAAAQEAHAEGQAALAKGDFAAYGAAQKRLEAQLNTTNRPPALV